MQHLTGYRYELGVINKETGELVWRDNYDLVEEIMQTEMPIIQTFVEKDLEKSYLIRKADYDGVAVYELHISGKQKIEGGYFTEDCGKGCTREIESKMIDS